MKFIFGLAVSVGLWAQSGNYEQTIKDGRTPLVLEPGTPAGSYALSGFESVSLYSGSVNIQVPLLRIGGRGESGYQMTVPVRQLKWSGKYDTTSNVVGEDGSIDYSFAAGATAESWSAYRAYYGPGMLVLKRSGEGLIHCGSNGGLQMNETFSQFVFHTPDGGETSLYSVSVR